MKTSVSSMSLLYDAFHNCVRLIRAKLLDSYFFSIRSSKAATKLWMYLSNLYVAGIILNMLSLKNNVQV